ncbi:MAG: hypothetical protein U5L01_06990 [Rheinheimera sp.]|nr:hypothetical protein [Rheinheimera sp.]
MHAQLRAKASPVMGKLLKPIEELVANATSLEDLLQQLLHARKQSWMSLSWLK